MRELVVISIFAALAGACASDYFVGSGGTTSAAAETGGTTRVVVETGVEDPSVGESTDEGVGTGVGESSDEDTGTTAANETGGETEGGSSNVSAQVVLGGLDRLFVFAEDAETCMRLVLVTPPFGNTTTIDVPMDWDVESAHISSLPSDCMGPEAPAGMVADAVMGEGSVSWEPLGDPPFPCLIDVDVTLFFAPGEPWVPAEGSIVAEGVMVEGCGE